MTLVDARRPPVAVPPKPRLRGVLHQVAAMIALGAGGVLIATAPTRQAALAAAIYSATLVAMFAISALYHRPTWSPPIRSWLRRLDHGAIFLLIAGTSTPIALLALGGAAGYRLLMLTWTVAALGVVQAILWPKAPKLLVVTLYLAAGWLALPFVPQLRLVLPAASLALVVAGGVLYTLGALVYGFKRPDPFPTVFGYHEIFHAFTLLAALCHFIVVLGIIDRAA